MLVKDILQQKVESSGNLKFPLIMSIDEAEGIRTEWCLILSEILRTKQKNEVSTFA